MGACVPLQSHLSFPIPRNWGCSSLDRVVVLCSFVYAILSLKCLFKSTSFLALCLTPEYLLRLHSVTVSSWQFYCNTFFLTSVSAHRQTDTPVQVSSQQSPHPSVITPAITSVTGITSELIQSAYSPVFTNKLYGNGPIVWPIIEYSLSLN